MTDSLPRGADPITQRLAPGEELIWRGRPQQGRYLRDSDALLITFGLPFAGATSWALVMVIIWGIPTFSVSFFVIGWIYSLFFLFGRFFFDAWIRARVFYALTNQRILIVRSRPSTKVQSIDWDQAPEPILKASSTGRGTITFGRVLEFWQRHDRGGIGLSIASLEPTPQFLAIEDARKVFALVQERMRTAKSQAAKSIGDER